MCIRDRGSRGTDVTLTIDQVLQFEAEKVISETVSEWSAISATCIIMDPTNGEILAMANAPMVDANNFSQISIDQQRNRAVVDTYEPGSVFKAVTVASGLEVGAVAPGQYYHLPSELEL